MVSCEFCSERMTSAPSHMDHVAECSKNPKVEVVQLRTKVKLAVMLLREVLSDADILTNRK